MRIGHDVANGTQYFPGLIDEVKIYNTALTSDQVKLDYNKGASLALGSLGTTSDGKTASSSASAIYCIPGDTTSCNPPVAQWNFDEAGGPTANDTGGAANTGTLSGPTWVSGKIGGALKFDGNDDYINAGTNSSLDITGAKTISAWIKVSGNANNNMRIFSKRESFGGAEITGYELTINPSSCLLNSYHTGKNPTVTATVTGCNNTWKYITAVYNGTQGLIYIDGQYANAATFAVADSNSTAVLIGTCGSEYNNGASGCDFNGQIDNLKVYNYSRTPAQIAYDYNRGAPVGWWKFDECQGAQVFDKSGNGNTGTIELGASGQTSAGSCTVNADTAWYNGRTGKYNASLKFDGVDDGITVNSLYWYDQMTWSLWVKYASISGFRPILQTGGANDGVSLSLYTAGQIAILYPGVDWIITSNTMTTGQWYHIVYIRDINSSGATKNRIYINGQEAKYSYRPAITGITATGSTSHIGFSTTTGGSGYFSGQTDEVQIYNYPLTTIQIKNLFNQGASVRFGPAEGNP
jgi:hypothetical protein